MPEAHNPSSVYPDDEGVGPERSIVIDTDPQAGVPRRIIPLVHTILLEGEGPGYLPPDFPDHIAEIIEQDGEPTTLDTTGDGFSEDVDEAHFVRVTGEILFLRLAERGIHQFAENYDVHWLDIMRRFCNPRLRPHGNRDRAAVINGLFEPGQHFPVSVKQHFPVHGDKTAGSIAIGCSRLPKSGGGRFGVSLEEGVVGIDSLMRVADYRIPMMWDQGVIFDGRHKLHGSEAIQEGDEPRLTIALSYWDPTDKTERPVGFNSARKTKN